MPTSRPSKSKKKRSVQRKRTAPASATPLGRVLLKLEHLEDRVNLTMDATLTTRAVLSERIDRVESTLSARIDVLEAVVRQNSADIRQNSDDIRQNSEDIRKNSEDIRQNSADIRQNSEDIARCNAELAAHTESLRAHSEAILGLQRDFRRTHERIGAVESRVESLERA